MNNEASKRIPFWFRVERFWTKFSLFPTHVHLRCLQERFFKVHQKAKCKDLHSTFKTLCYHLIWKVGFVDNVWSKLYIFFYWNIYALVPHTSYTIHFNIPEFIVEILYSLLFVNTSSYDMQKSIFQSLTAGKETAKIRIRSSGSKLSIDII